MNNKVKHLISTLLLFIVVITSAACEGPAGPQGPKGEEGASGPKGDQGPQGEEGTANVIYSEWLDIVWNQSDNNTNKSMYINESRVSEDDFMETGMVVVYLREVVSGSTPVIYPLPYSFGSTYLYPLVTNVPNLQGILLMNSSTDGGNVSSLNGVQIRYILIPGGIPAKMNPSFLNDYDAVVEYYGLEE